MEMEKLKAEDIGVLWGTCNINGENDWKTLYKMLTLFIQWQNQRYSEILFRFYTVNLIYLSLYNNEYNTLWHHIRTIKIFFIRLVCTQRGLILMGKWWTIHVKKWKNTLTPIVPSAINQRTILCLHPVLLCAISRWFNHTVATKYNFYVMYYLQNVLTPISYSQTIEITMSLTNMT